MTHPLTSLTSPFQTWRSGATPVERWSWAASPRPWPTVAGLRP